MILAAEITEWDNGNFNHTYLLNNAMDRVIGYYKRNEKDFTKFNKPLRFSTSRRKFNIIQRFEEETNNKQWKIKGSKDHVYYVEETNKGMICTCIGFKYHQKCKHIEEVSIMLISDSK